MNLKKEGLKMKKFTILISAMVVILLLAVVATSCTTTTTPEPTQPSQPTPQPTETKEPITLRLIQPAPPGDQLVLKDEALAERFNSRAGGDYVIKVFPDETLAKTPEFFDAVRTGAAEIAAIGWPIFTFQDSRLGLIALPFLFDTVEGFAGIQDDLVELYDPVFKETFNAKPLAAFNTGGMDYIGNKPVHALGDWKDLLIGAIDAPLAYMVDQWGAGSQVIMWVDLFGALEKNVVDGAMMGLHGTIEMKMTDVIQYVTVLYSESGMNGYTINLDVWNKMPANIQNILLEEAATTCTEFNNLFIEYDKTDPDKIRGMGIDVYHLPKAERDKWQALVMSYTNEELDKGGEIGAKLRQLAEEANKKYPYKER
jgi:TRAP-type C4-dicarboxylate transport system substrate-binding protein